MHGIDLTQRLKKQQAPERYFIRWWQEDPEDSDYETVQTFLNTTPPDMEIAGYEVLDLEEMWDTLNQLHPESVTRESRPSGDRIIWLHDSGAGEMVIEDCPYTPESVMAIFKLETSVDR